MALAVDAAGKVKANPKTGKVAKKVANSFARSAVNVLNDIVQSAPVSSKVSPNAASSNSNGVTKVSPSTPLRGMGGSGYTGISGGTPVTLKSNQPQQAWSPIYDSLLDSPDKPESYWGYMQEENGSQSDSGNVNKQDADQQSEESSGLAPEVNVKSSSMDKYEPVDWNEVYEKDMTDQGLPADYIDKVLKETNGVSAAIDESNGLDKKWRRDLLDPLTTTTDDGTMDRPHLLSDWMTGKQYYHYVHDLGIPGLPENQIDVSDRGKYSKTQERQNNGFQPYIPNSTYELGLSVPSLGSVARSFDEYLSNLRTNGYLNDVDYQITTDTGHGIKSFSGRDFDKMSNGYASQTEDLYERAREGDPDAMSILLSAENHESPYTTMVRERELPDGTKHYGVVTEERGVNDLTNEDVFNDLVWWGIDENTTASYPDKNGMSTYGNVTLKFDRNNNILSGTLHTKDGFDLNVEPSSDGSGSFQLVTDDDAFNKWWDSHNSGDTYVAFSDGSSAVISAEDIDKAMKENPGENWIGDTLVSYDNTSLRDIENFNPESLTVGNPTSLSDHLENGEGSEIGVMYVPDMILSDGTPISRDAVLKIANDDNPDDSDEDGITYDFELSGLNPRRLPFPFSVPLAASNPLLAFTDSRPRRLIHNEIIDEDGPHFGMRETPDWLVDAALDSIPLMAPGYRWVDAGAKALPYAAGVESSSGDEYGRYQDTGNESGSEEDSMKMAATLFGPKLEDLAGLSHDQPLLDPIVEKLISKNFAEGTLPHLFLSKGWDSIGEAMEEVVGNYVDELSTYGLRNAWANPISYPYAGMDGVYDSDHNLLYEIGDDIDSDELSAIYDDMIENHGKNGQLPILYDENGREFRDPNTSAIDRISNAFAPTPDNLRDTANAALGGGGVSLLYSMPELMYGLGGAAVNLMSQKNKNRNDNFSTDEWKIGSDDDDISSSGDEIYVPESLKSDRISSNDYRISPGAPIRFKE